MHVKNSLKGKKNYVPETRKIFQMAPPCKLFGKVTAPNL
jgi:hypothetical protein